MRENADQNNSEYGQFLRNGELAANRLRMDIQLPVNIQNIVNVTFILKRQWIFPVEKIASCSKSTIKKAE